jgi:hypothetical protein
MYGRPLAEFRTVPFQRPSEDKSARACEEGQAFCQLGTAPRTRRVKT